MLVVAGSRTTPGAAVLAVEGALRSGAGKVQLVTVTSVAVTVPEALVVGGPENDAGELTDDAASMIIEYASKADVVLLGPGFMSPQTAADVARAVVPKLEAGLVLDALCLSFLADDPEPLKHLHGRCILTPNTGEIALALGVTQESLDDLPDQGATKLASSTGAVVSSGGGTAWIATPDGRRWRDRSGGPGLGVSGSGDVKAGVVAALLARTTDPAAAAVWGTHLHAWAGERLAARTGTVGYLPRELPLELPSIMQDLHPHEDPRKRKGKPPTQASTS